MVSHECVEKFYIRSTSYIILLAMCIIQYWVLVLNVNTALSLPHVVLVILA